MSQAKPVHWTEFFLNVRIHLEKWLISYLSASEELIFSLTPKSIFKKQGFLEGIWSRHPIILKAFDALNTTCNMY